MYFFQVGKQKEKEKNESKAWEWEMYQLLQKQVMAGWCAVLCLGLHSEISFSSLFAYTMSCSNYSHISTTACVLGKRTATEYVLGTEKGKVFCVVFTAFYLPLGLTDREESTNIWQRQTSFPSQARQSYMVSFSCTVTPSSAEYEAVFDIVHSWFRHHILGLPWADLYRFLSSCA